MLNTFKIYTGAFSGCAAAVWVVPNKTTSVDVANRRLEDKKRLQSAGLTQKTQQIYVMVNIRLFKYAVKAVEVIADSQYDHQALLGRRRREQLCVARRYGKLVAQSRH